MPFQSIEPRRLYRQIADQIRALIASGEFRAGGRLPPERDLARQLGVSRPSVREALIALEVEGLVEVRIGSGIYVLGANGREHEGAAPRVQAEAGPFELLRARSFIESECAAQAAKVAKKPQIEGIADALEQMARELGDDRQPLAGDRLFHLRIAEAARSSPWSRCCGRSAPVRSTRSSSTTTIPLRCGPRRWPSIGPC
jgi:DNA-binding FadR family transcriptional regulator